MEVFSSKNQDLIKKHHIDTYADQISFFRNFDKPKWLNDSQFGFQFKNEMSLSISAESDERIWSEVNSKNEEFFKKQIDYNEKMSPEELVKLMNW